MEEPLTYSEYCGFGVGELILYQNGDRYEIGKIKKLTSNGAFVWYSEGETAAKTSYSDMKKILNRHCITDDKFGRGWSLE